MSEFWQAIFRRAGTRLGITSAYHPNADGQSEKTNNTMKVTLCCILTQQLSEGDWNNTYPKPNTFC